MSEENVHSIKLRTRLVNQQSASPKRKRGRPRKAGNEMPKRTRVGRTHNHEDSQRKACLLESGIVDFESSYSGEQVQTNTTSDDKTVFNIGEIKTILRGIGESFVRWIIEGVQAVRKETVLEASRQIQTIKSLLHEREASTEKSKSARQRKSVELITPLMDSVNYLTMVIDNYLQNIVEKQEEDKGHDLSFADMFQADIDDTENMSFSKQDSTTVKSILKTSKIDCDITRKRISFAENATKVYQDNETSQISLAKSSPSVKSLEGNATTTSATGNSEINNTTSREVRTNLFRPELNVTTPKRLEPEVVLMKPPPYDTSLADESPSIIESSFLNDSVSSVQANYIKNLKKFKPKMRNNKQIQDPIFDDKGNQIKNMETFTIFQTNLERNSANVEGTELENTDHPNTYDTPCNIFSDELVKTFMSQITGNSAEENVSKLSENVLPFHDFVLTLPESSSSEESLDASVRMALNIAKGSDRNPEVGSPRNDDKDEDKTEWIWRPDNSTEIIPSTEQFGKGSTGWMETPWENVKDHCHATSDNSSLNVSLLFDETNEASWIPGNTTSSLFPSLKPFSNSEVNKQGNDINENANYNNLRPNNFDEIRQDQGVGLTLKMETADDESRNAEQRNPIQGININTNVNQLIETPQASNSIQQNMTGQIMLNEKQRDLWKPRNFSSFSALTLSDTEPARNKHLDFKHVLHMEQPDNQETNKTEASGWDLKNMGSLGRGTSVCPKENLGTASGVSLESGTIPKQNKSTFATRNFDNQNNYLGNSLFTGNLFNNKFQPSRTSSAFPAYTTLDDTELVKATSTSNQSNTLTNVDKGKYRLEKNKGPYVGALISQTRGDGGLERSNYSSQHVQPHQTSVRQQGPNLNALLNQNGLKENRAAGRNEQQSGEQHSSFTSCTRLDDTSLQFAEATSSFENTNWSTNHTHDEETKENRLNVSGKKLQKSRPKKKASTSKRNSSKVKNEFIHETQTLDGPVTKDSQKQKSSQRKTKTTRQKSPVRRTKTASIPENLHEVVNKEITSNAQNVGLMLNKLQPSVIQKVTISSDRRSSRDGYSNPTNIEDPSREVFLRPFDVKRNTKKRGEQNSTPALMNHLERELSAQVGNITSSTVGGWSDLKHDNFNFFNPNTSKNDEDNLYTYQSRGVDVKKGYLNINVKNNALQSNQEQNCEEIYSTAPGSQMSFMECDNLSRDEFPDGVNADGSESCRNSRSNTPRKEIRPENVAQAKTNAENPIEYLSLTQLSWGQSATCGIPTITMQSCTPMRETGEKQHSFQSARSANSKSNTPHEETHIENIIDLKTNAENPIEYQSLTQLSWGQSATCGIPTITMQSCTPMRETGEKHQSFQSARSANSKSNTLYEETHIGNIIHPKTNAENPIEYQSLTQLSWGQSATCGIPTITTQSCTPMRETGEKQQNFQSTRSVNSNSNTPHEETHIGNIIHPKINAEKPIECQSLTQLSWGQSATCGIPTVSSQLSSIYEIGVNQKTSKSSRSPTFKGTGRIKNVTTQPANNDPVFKQPFTPGLTADTNQPLSFTEFMQDICASSTENVLDSAPSLSKTEEEQIEEILNGIEFVRVPSESELIEVTNIEELINDHSFIW